MPRGYLYIALNSSIYFLKKLPRSRPHPKCIQSYSIIIFKQTTFSNFSLSFFMIMENANIDIAPVDFIDDGRIAIGRVRNLKSVLHRTAKNQFKRFLRLAGSPYETLDDIPEIEVQDSLLGRFSNYLRTQGKYKFNTHDNYVSAIHVAITNKYPLKKQEFGPYYKKFAR